MMIYEVTVIIIIIITMNSKRNKIRCLQILRQTKAFHSRNKATGAADLLCVLYDVSFLLTANDVSQTDRHL